MKSARSVSLFLIMLREVLSKGRHVKTTRKRAQDLRQKGNQLGGLRQDIDVIERHHSRYSGTWLLVDALECRADALRGCGSCCRFLSH